MHSATFLPRAEHGKLTVIALGAMLCLASAGSLAAAAGTGAAPAFANPAPKDKAVSLKLDLGLAMGGDDCEEDYADLLRVASTSGVPPAAAKPAVSKPAAAAAPLAAPLAVAAAVPVAVAAVVPPAAPATPVAAPLPSWVVIPSDKTLNAAVGRWAAAAGWQLVWELPVDYAVTVRTEIRGTFSEAVETVAKSMETAEVPMKAIFYDGNKVLRIVAKGTE